MKRRKGKEETVLQVVRLELRLAWLVLAIVALCATNSCGRDPDRWQAIVYPGGDLPNHVALGEHTSLESCFQEAQRYLRSVGGGTYECGKNCEPRTSLLDGTILYMCEETRGSPATGMHN
jgi:hypothetical protein